MLWLQAGASDFSRRGSKGRPARLLIQTNRSPRSLLVVIWVLSVVVGLSILAPDGSAQSKGRKGKPRPKAAPSASPGEQSLTNIPLPIGHEAKGLVLPDFDAVTMFHLYEFSHPNTASAEYGGITDRGLLDLMTAKIRPGGHMLFYTKSNGWMASETIIPVWEKEQPVERVEDFKTLRVYRKKG